MASFIPKSFINDLLTRCDIVGLISQFIPLRKQGRNYLARCPFHEESTPSFSISETKQIYHCFGCGVGGNAISFVMNYEKLEFVAAIEWLANHLQLTIPKNSSGARPSNRLSALYTALSDSVSFYQAQLRNTPQALDYLKKRGISTASIEQFNIGFAPSSWDALSKFLRHTKQHTLENLQIAGLVIKKTSTHTYDRFRARIIFPIRDRQGRFIGLGGRILNQSDEPKYLNSPEMPIFYKSRELYGLYESYSSGKKTERIWVVEGYLDVVTLYQFNVVPVVATLGTTTSPSHLQQLFRSTQEVVFCFDGDEAGQKAAIRALELSLKHVQDAWTIRFLLLPKGEDPDSWIRKLSSTDSKALLHHALSIEDFLFQYIQQGINLGAPEGQRQLLQKAIPLLKKMPANIRRVQLFQRLARLSNIEVDRLERLYTQPYTAKQQIPSQQAQSHTVLDRAIGLLLQYPKLLITHLSDTISHRLETEYVFLGEVVNVIRKTKEPHTAILLEQFRNTPSKLTYLMQLAQYDWLVPEAGVMAEFQDILVHLDKSSRARKVQSLIQKARESKLSSEEKKQLNQLLSERQSS